MRWRMIGVVGLLAVLTACGSRSPVSDAGSASSVAPPTSTPTDSPGSTAGSTADSSGSPSAESTTSKSASGDCKSAELSLAVQGGEGAAGTVYRKLVFTNTSKRTCTMQGFPGVSYVAGADGHQVGPAAYRDGAKGAAVTVAPGGSAVAPVGFVNVRNYDAAVCKPTPVRGLRVYPPQETASMFVAMDGLGCAGTPPGNQLVVKTIVKS